MPFIITDAMLKAADQMVAGWTLMKLNSVKEIVTKDGKGQTILEFEGLEGPGNSDDNQGRLLPYFIYHNALTGQRAVPDVINDIVSMVMAFEGKTREEVVKMLSGQELDFGRCVGKAIYAEVVDDVYNGRTLKKIKTFSPKDKVPF